MAAATRHITVVGMQGTPGASSWRSQESLKEPAHAATGAIGVLSAVAEEALTVSCRPPVPSRSHACWAARHALSATRKRPRHVGIDVILCRDMEMNEVAPDEHTIVFALTAAARSRGTALAHVEAVLELARRYGLQRNTYVCAALIQAYRNCMEVPPPQRQRLGEGVLRDMEAAGLRVNGVLLNSLLALYWETFEYRKARLLYDKMLEMGVMPNDRTCQIMVQMCEEAGWLEEATGFQQLRRTMHEIESTRNVPWNVAGVEVLHLDDRDETDTR